MNLNLRIFKVFAGYQILKRSKRKKKTKCLCMQSFKFRSGFGEVCTTTSAMFFGDVIQTLASVVEVMHLIKASILEKRLILTETFMGKCTQNCHLVEVKRWFYGLKFRFIAMRQRSRKNAICEYSRLSISRS